MDTYFYKLTEDEYYTYAKNVVIRKGGLQASRLRFASIGPVICILLVVGFRLFAPWKLLCALLISALWVIFAGWLFARSIRNQTEDYCRKNGRPDFEEICLQVDDDSVRINQTQAIPEQYLLLKKMIVLYFKKGSELIVPARIFENQEQMRDFMKKVVKQIYVNGNQGDRII